MSQLKGILKKIYGVIRAGWIDYKRLKERNPDLLSVKSISLSLFILLFFSVTSFYTGIFSQASTIKESDRDLKNEQKNSLIAAQKFETINSDYNTLKSDYDKYKEEMSLFEKLDDTDKLAIADELQRREDEAASKKAEEKKKAEEATRIEEERLAKVKLEKEKVAAEKEKALKAEAETKKEAKKALVVTSNEENILDNLPAHIEEEYDAARREIEDVINNSWANMGYFTFNEDDYTFTLSITDQALKDTIKGVMIGDIPKGEWAYYITDGMISLSTTVSNSYGYGNFGFAIANPYDSNYRLLHVMDGEVYYDFADDLP